MTSSLSSDGKGVMAFKNSSGFYLPKFKHLTNDELAEACYEMVRTVAGKLEEGQGGANVVEEILERVEGWRGKGGERGSKYGGSGVGKMERGAKDMRSGWSEATAVYRLSLLKQRTSSLSLRSLLSLCSSRILLEHNN